MANKQKLQKNVSKKPQGEKTQRSVHIVKHFQPNVVYNKLHRNCDLPEVDTDVDSKETSIKIKKSIVSQAFSNENKKVRISSTTSPNNSRKNERNSGKALDSHSTPLLHKLNTANKLKSDTKRSLTSGSSTTKESLPLKLNKTSWAFGVKSNGKQNILKKPFLKSSSTISSTSSKENYSTKAKTFQTNKSKSFSVSVPKKDKVDPKSKFGDKSRTVEDLKKEIRANQLQKLGSYAKNNNNPNSRHERVQNLRDEIKKLINTNIDDKRKHLTELTTEIAEFRTNKNVLIYNVDIHPDKKNEPVESVQEISCPNDNETVDVLEDSTKNESNMKCSKKFCGLPVEALETEDHRIHIEHALSSTDIEDVRSVIQVETKPKQCHKCVTTEEVVQSKILETNKLIENLQKTLNEIRYRTKPPQIADKTEIVGSKTEEAVEIVDDTENNAGGISTEKESDGESKAASVSDVNEASSSEAESPLPPQQAPNTTPEEPHVESETLTVEEVKISDEHIDVEDDIITVDLFRPKTRRPCGCRKKSLELTDKFRTSPEGRTKEMDDFDILQAKLDAIVESADSDEAEPKTSDGPRVSFVGSSDWLFRDFVSTGPSTGTRSVSTAAQSVATAAGSSQTESYQPVLVQKTTDSFEISPEKPQLKLTLQMLPSLNIRREPVVRKLVNFYIDAQGTTHVTFKNEGCNVGFFEMQSSSLIEVYSSNHCEVQSTTTKVHDKKADETGWELFNEGISHAAGVVAANRSHENKPHRMRKHRSISNPELYLSKGGTIKSGSAGSQQHLERRRVLQSYQLLDNRPRHDPGLLSALSLDVISGIDEDVYKTYINPKGFTPPPTSISAYSTYKPKTATLEKLSSLKSLCKPSDTAESVEQSERMKVLKSYQLLENQNRHDPGELRAVSREIISTIDANVYKTYINPEGFPLTSVSHSTSSAPKPKIVPTEKLSSISSLKKASGSDTGQKKMKTEAEKSSQADSKTNVDKTESSGAPKLYNIGLYKSRSTQIAPVDRRKETKDRKAKAAEDEKTEETEKKEKTEEKDEKTIREEKEEPKVLGKMEIKQLPLDEFAILKHQKEIEQIASMEGRIGKTRSREREKDDARKIEQKEKEEQESEEEEKERDDDRPEEEEEVALKHLIELEENAKRQEHKEKYKSREIAKDKTGKVVKKEEKYGMEEEPDRTERVGKNKLPLDELALKHRKEIERIQSREERKEKRRRGEIEKNDRGKREDKEVVSVSLVASSLSGEYKVPRSSMSYERISFSISYSTEESTITESSSMAESLSEEQQFDRRRYKSASYTRSSKGSQTFKNLKEKITKEHAFEQPSNAKKSVDDDEISVPNFISGLLDTSTASIKRVIPKIRRSVRVAKSDIRNSVLLGGKSSTKLVGAVDGESSGQLPRSSADRSSPKTKASPEKKTRTSAQATDGKRSSPLTNRKSFNDDHEEKELRNHNYHVSPVHVQGDFAPSHRRMAKHLEYAPAPLRLGKNGRYQDEEDLFCESNSPRYETSLHRRFRAIPESLYKTTKFTLDSSNSDTVTNAERASSEGEVRCECSVSIGEIHACRRRRSPSRLQRQPAFSTTGERSAGIRKRRTYFNNWVTYYVNKNAMSVNDSSSTS